MSIKERLEIIYNFANDRLKQIEKEEKSDIFKYARQAGVALFLRDELEEILKKDVHYEKSRI